MADLVFTVQDQQLIHILRAVLIEAFFCFLRRQPFVPWWWQSVGSWGRHCHPAVSKNDTEMTASCKGDIWSDTDMLHYQGSVCSIEVTSARFFPCLPHLCQTPELFVMDDLVIKWWRCWVSDISLRSTWHPVISFPFHTHTHTLMQACRRTQIAHTMQHASYCRLSFCCLMLIPDVSSPPKHLAVVITPCINLLLNTFIRPGCSVLLILHHTGVSYWYQNHSRECNTHRFIITQLIQLGQMTPQAK